MKIDKAKEYVTRDGKPVRVYSTDNGGTWPVHGAISQPDGSWYIVSRLEDGRSSRTLDNDSDFVEKKPTYTRWVTFYRDGRVEQRTYKVVWPLDVALPSGIVGQVEVTFEEGTGLGF